MELKHEFTVPATLDETWAAFNDIESVAACFPGASVTSVEDETFHGSCKVKLGPIALVYNGSGTFVEKDEAAHRMVIDAKGKDKRGNGTAGAHVTATMTDAGGGSTRVEVLTDLAITGKPAQFGRGVMQDVSDKLLGQFTDCLEQKVGDSSAASRAATEAAAQPPSEATGTPDTSEPPGTATTVSEPAPSPVTQTTTATDKQTPAPVQDLPRTAPSNQPPQPQQDDALDLGATVLPVLAKLYWRQALAAVIVLLVLRRLLRR